MPDQPEPKGLTDADLDELWNVASDKHKRREIGELTLKRLVHQARLFLVGQRSVQATLQRWAAMADGTAEEE